MRRSLGIAFFLFVGVRLGAAADAVRVACVGDTRTGIGESGYAPLLSAVLGPRYQVRDFGREGLALTPGLSMSFAGSSELRSSREFAPHVIVLHGGLADADPALWASRRDGFVSATKKLLSSLLDQSPRPRLFVALPDVSALARDDERRRPLEAGVGPLLRQAAREAGVRVVDLHGTAGAPDFVAEAVATVVADPTERRGQWRVVFTNATADEEAPPSMAIDSKLETSWVTLSSRKARRHPHELQVDVGQAMEASGFRYVPRQDGGGDGRVARFEVFLSMDGKHWGKPVALGELPDTPRSTWIRFPKSTHARYFRFRSLSEVSGGRTTSAAEIDLLHRLGDAVR